MIFRTRTTGPRLCSSGRRSDSRKLLNFERRMVNVEAIVAHGRLVETHIEWYGAAVRRHS